jgi:hypothetical protein
MAHERPALQGGRPARPLLVWVTQGLFFLNAVVWIAFGVLYLGDAAGTTRGGWIAAALMFANAVVLTAIGWGLGTRRWWFYYLALLVLLVNIVLGMTDQVGLADVLVMALNAVMLVLVFVNRGWYAARQ